ncbi:MAG: phosphate-starvation-inducible PsiE family protein [Deltaproteobacteria bacterium]|nr:phosphate-starvation-inducible PsiE family protein [Deltaproteobacteria bacterium]
METPVETNEQKKTTIENRVIGWFGRLFSYLDDIILIIVSLGIIAVAIIVMSEAFFDIFTIRAYSVTHIISDLMFVLIIMELFRQVMRQFLRHQFSLNPFLFIGVIASIRGMLIMQMGLAMGEVEWTRGVIQAGVYAVIVLILVVCYYFTSKTERAR